MKLGTKAALGLAALSPLLFVWIFTGAFGVATPGGLIGIILGTMIMSMVVIFITGYAMYEEGVVSERENKLYQLLNKLGEK